MLSKILTRTAISFSTSLPTLQYYSWLFGNGSANADIDYSQSSLGPEPGTGLTHDTQHRLPTGSYDPTISLPSPPHQNGPWTAFNSQTLAQNQDRNTGLLSPESGQGATTKPSTARQSPVPGGNPSYLSPPSNSNQGGTSELGIIGLDSPHQYFSPSRPPDASRQPGISRQSGMSRHPDPNEQPNNFVQPVSHSPNPHNLPPPDSFVRKGPRRLPKVTDEARDGLMQLISKSRPTRPDKSEINSSDPLLSLSSLQHYSDLFFTCFNSTYPLIHPGTFNSSMVEPLLLMSIILLGASYGDKKAHLLAVCIHDIMRPLIHSSREFGPRPKLWMLQTILLVECFGKSRAGERQHDMSNIYHGLQIK